MMANDPNRDLLPVKEETNGKCASNERFDHQILAKLPRVELEDKFLRLLDEQTNLKKLVNSQEEKIKRLGTKLLRLIGEKKSGKKTSEPSKEIEELTLRITELEHENYALKDKNVVLKQQLANHTRHIISHRSPVRSNHTSPLMSVRQPAPPLQTDLLFEASNKNASSESQLREAESHIKELNEEIKALHCKIDFLQKNMERNCLDSRKSKVSENIEIIRLQRSLKQQAIQIAALQAQVKNSENNQKILKEELVKAHNENDEALHLISVKQNEILNLCNKLEEKNLSRLEEGELRERINDLMIERDCLKERSDFLMKSIGDKSEETARINELKKLLAEEKLKKEQLEETLESMQKKLLSVKNEESESSPSRKIKSTDIFSKDIPICRCRKSPRAKIRDCRFEFDEEEVKNLETEPKTEAHLEKPKASLYKCPTVILSPSSFENDTKVSESPKEEVQDEKTVICDVMEGKYYAEKLNLEREVEYLREMLRSQTCRCDAQQSEIKRLMFELKVNEEKCSETLRKLDDHLKLFQNFKIKNQENKPILVNTGVGEDDVKKSLEPIVVVKKSPEPIVEVEKSPEPVVEVEKSPEPIVEAKKQSREVEIRETNPKVEPIREQRKSEKSEDLGSPNSPGSPLSRGWRMSSADEKSPESSKTVTLQIERKKPEQKKRFIDQVFLESSDDELENEEHFKKKESAVIKPAGLEGESDAKENCKREESEFNWAIKSVSSSKTYENYKKVSQSHTSLESDAKRPSDAQKVETAKEPERKIRSVESSRRYNMTRSEGLDVSRFVEIGILWLKIDPKSSVGQNENVKLLFVDFSFLNINGEETETPDSVPKPTKAEEKCHFNFWKIIDIDDNRKKNLQSLLNTPDLDLIVFKVVSEPEDHQTDFDCEDIGVGTVTVQQFLDHCAKGPFSVSIGSMANPTEVIGTLVVSVDASPELFNYRQ